MGGWGFLAPLSFHPQDPGFLFRKIYEREKMARRRSTPKEDFAPRKISKKEKPNFKLYDEYEERLKQEGDTWILEGYFDGEIYEIPVRTKYAFGAIADRYRLLLKAERDMADPMTGQIFPGDNRAAQFSDGRFDTRDMFEVRGLYRSRAFAAGRIWDQDTEGAKQRENSYQHMKSMLLGDPEFKARFLEEMKEAKAEEAKEEKTPAA
jgi:hypothetical protein